MRRGTTLFTVSDYASNFAGAALLYAPLLRDTTHCYINHFGRASRVERPWQGGENRTAAWPSRHNDLVSDGVVSPPMFDRMVVPERGMVLPRCHSLAAAMDTDLDAAARVRGAERAADGGVVSVPQVFHTSPRTPPMHAQRIAQFDHYYARNLLPSKRLRRGIP